MNTTAFRPFTEGPLARPVRLLGTAGVLDSVRAAVALYGSYGDPHDQLSRTQVEQLNTLAALFADDDGPLDGPLYLVGEIGVLGALRSAVELYSAVHGADEALSPEQVEHLAALAVLFADGDGDGSAPAPAGTTVWVLDRRARRDGEVTLWADEESAFCALAEFVRENWDNVYGDDGVAPEPPADDRTAVRMYYGPDGHRDEDGYSIRPEAVGRRGAARRAGSAAQG